MHRSRAEREAAEAALVLRAMGIEHDVVAAEGGYLLLVAPIDAPRALEELRRFRAENPPGRADEQEPGLLASGVDGAVGWALVLVAMHLLVTRHAWDLDWEAAGIADAAAIRAGAWWRAVTALTLHADLSHLAGNVLFGAVFLGALCQFTGTGVAVLLCVLSGALGNALNAWLQGGHLSLGASTAVFGALGALAAMQWRHRVRLRQRKLRRWTPLVMAAILLGYLGTEGVRTDIVAHVTGLASGLALGALPCWVSRRDALTRRGVQWLALLASFGLVGGAWSCALSGA